MGTRPIEAFASYLLSKSPLARVRPAIRRPKTTKPQTGFLVFLTCQTGFVACATVFCMRKNDVAGKLVAGAGFEPTTFGL